MYALLLLQFSIHKYFLSLICSVYRTALKADRLRSPNGLKYPVGVKFYTDPH